MNWDPSLKTHSLSSDALLINAVNISSYNTSVELIQVLLDLPAGQNMELPVGPNDSHFNVGIVHLALKSFLQGQQGSVDSILDLHIGFVSLL